MWNWISALEQFSKAGDAVVLITVIRTVGSVPRGVGARMIVKEDGTTLGTIGGGLVEKCAVDDALRCLSAGQSGIFSYALTAESGQCCGGRVELFMDVLNLRPRLTVFGAGHVGRALAAVMGSTMFETELVDDRGDWVNGPELPIGTKCHQIQGTDFIASAKWRLDSSYVAIMTPSHAQDMEILKCLLPQRLRYLGMIGSRTKWMQFRRQLLAEGFPPDQFERVRCPIGVGRTGNAPAEIAISIAAEILLDYYGNSGRSTDLAGGGEVGASRCAEGSAALPQPPVD